MKMQSKKFQKAGKPLNKVLRIHMRTLPKVLVMPLNMLPKVLVMPLNMLLKVPKMHMKTLLKVLKMHMKQLPKKLVNLLELMLSLKLLTLKRTSSKGLKMQQIVLS